MASGHLALDSCGWHPFYQGTTLISLTSAVIRADKVAYGRGRADGLTATVNVDCADDAESGRRPGSGGPWIGGVLHRRRQRAGRFGELTLTGAALDGGPCRCWPSHWAGP